MNDAITRPRLLIIDDVPGNIRTLAAVLEDEYELSMATNGLEGLDLAASLPPDLILLDVVMPGMDGYEVCRRLKADADTSAIPVIFVTALDEAGEEAMGLELGAVDFIVKPFSPAVVQGRIKTQISLKRANEALLQQHLKLAPGRNHELLTKG